MKRSDCRGYTFVEVMMTVGIFTAAMAALYAGLVSGSATYNSYDAMAVAQREATKAIFHLTKDIRQARDLTFVRQEANDLELTFSHSSEGTVTYTWTTSGSEAQQVRRQAESEEDSQLIATRISDLDITESAGQVAIDVTAYAVMKDGSSNSFRLFDKVKIRLP